MADYGMEGKVYDINLAAARIARQAIDEYISAGGKGEKFVAGSIGPTNKTASMSADVSSPAARAVTFDRAWWRPTAGRHRDWSTAGLTCCWWRRFDTLNAKRPSFALENLFAETGRRLPVMVSGTITDASGRMLTGQTLEAFMVSVSHFPRSLVGLNCAFGAEKLRPFVKEMSRISPFPVSVHPNAPGCLTSSEDMTSRPARWRS
ncbi:MAG: homocysteine S-methyltransferase family protein [Bacteroidales bacterium]